MTPDINPRKSLREIRRVEDVVYTLLKIARLDAGVVRMEKADGSYSHMNFILLFCKIYSFVR